MGKLSEEEKMELLKDARSDKLRADFKKLEKLKYRGFSLKYIEEIISLMSVTYPHHFIKTDKNKL